MVKSPMDVLTIAVYSLVSGSMTSSAWENCFASSVGDVDAVGVALASAVGVGVVSGSSAGSSSRLVVSTALTTRMAATTTPMTANSLMLPKMFMGKPGLYGSPTGLPPAVYAERRLFALS